MKNDIAYVGCYKGVNFKKIRIKEVFYAIEKDGWVKAYFIFENDQVTPTGSYFLTLTEMRSAIDKGEF